MNLKHLKFKIEALRCCDLALQDEFVKDEKRNMVLKVRLTVFSDVHRMIKKSKKEVEKAAKKAGGARVRKKSLGKIKSVCNMVVC
jgi:hypothetical protein